MHVGVVIAQIPITFSVEENVASLRSVLSDARPGDVVVTPEGSLSGYPPTQDDIGRLETANPTRVATALEALEHAIARRGVSLVVGACRRDGVTWVNEAILLRADGTRAGYRKVNLATHERGTFAAGDALEPIELSTPEGAIRLGFQICRDVRFPEQWRSLALSGAQVFVHPNAGRGDRATFATWRAMLVARAAENQRFVVSVNAVAADQHCPSVVVAPDGEIVGELDRGTPGSLRVELDLDRVSDRYLEQRRRDLGL